MREYERDGAKHRMFEVRADTIGKLDRTERRAEAGGSVLRRPDPIIA